MQVWRRWRHLDSQLDQVQEYSTSHAAIYDDSYDVNSSGKNDSDNDEDEAADEEQEIDEADNQYLHTGLDDTKDEEAPLDWRYLNKLVQLGVG